MDPATIAALISGGSALASSLGGDRGINWDEMTRYANGLQPAGYLTPDDLAAAEGTRTRLRSGVAATAKNSRALVQRRAAQRGTLASPALETSLARVNDAEALGNSNANASAEGQLYNMRIGRERFGQQKDLALLGGRMRSAGQAAGNRTLRHTAFVNSLLGLTKSSIDMLGNHGLESSGGGVPQGGDYSGFGGSADFGADGDY